MARCVLCRKAVDDDSDIHLLAGQAVHYPCLASLERELRRAEERLYEVRARQKRLQGKCRLWSWLAPFSRVLEGRYRLWRERLGLVAGETAAREEALSVLRCRLGAVYDLYPVRPPDWEAREAALRAAKAERCSRCGAGGYLYLNHVVPLSRGGDNRMANLELLCVGCYQKERAARRYPDDFFDEDLHHFDLDLAKEVGLIHFALVHGRRLEFWYKKPSQTKYRRRTIRPMEFTVFPHRMGGGRTFCILGYCELRRAERNFALKRMRSLRVR